MSNKATYYLKSNLQGLCRTCHHAKTLEEKAHTGPWPDIIARELAAKKRRYTF
jgi:5-methylcytosine-specific restriction endonuclease McrA